MTAPASIYLISYLEPIADMLLRDDVTDIYINKPQEVWVETLGGGLERHDAPGLDMTTLERLSRQIAAVSHQGISRAHPILSATLPGGARVQIVMPPATRGDIAIAVRKHALSNMTLTDYTNGGAFDEATTGKPGDKSDTDSKLAAMISARDFGGALASAVRARRNILISGGTSTGKTTFLNALMREIPAEERLILIEDTPELQLHHANAVGLLAARGDQSEAQVTTDDLLTSALRMRPDRIIVGELRGPEAFTFLRAVNTGHPGSMTTVHADSAQRAIEQITLLILQTGTRLDRDDIHHFVNNTVDVFVQLERVGGRRRVAEVMLNMR